MMEADSVNTF